MNLTQEITRLREEHDKIGDTIRTLETLLGKSGHVTATSGRISSVIPMPGKHKLSAAGRRRIALAQKARWANAKVGKRAA